MGTFLNILVAVGAGLLIVMGGIWALRLLSRTPPEPPPAGELRKVKLMYRCEICGTEMRMTVSPTEDPPPPMHCQDEMSLMAPIE